MATDDNNGNVLTIDSNGLKIFSSTGSLLQTVSTSYIPAALAVCRNSNIYVFYSNMSISAYNSTGSYKFSFGSTTSTGELGKFASTGPITCTHLDNIAVTDSYYSNSTTINRIQIFDGNGNYLGVYYLPIYPSFITRDGNADFLISSNNDVFTNGVFILNHFGSLLVTLNQYFGSIAGKIDLFQDNIYVADTNNYRVTVLNTNGIFAAYSTYPTHSSLAHCEYVSSEKVLSSHHTSSHNNNNTTSSHHNSLSTKKLFKLFYSIYNTVNYIIM